MNTSSSAAPSGSVICHMPFENSPALIIQVGGSLPSERLWLNREQAMDLLELLPEWLAKMPVLPNDAL